MCKHCEHVWIAVLGSVKVFPNLEAARLGVFNRVLNFFRKTSTSFHRRVGWREKCSIFLRELPDTSAHTRSRVSHALHSKQYQRRHQGHPLLERRTTAAHRLSACARTSPPTRSSWPDGEYTLCVQTPQTTLPLHATCVVVCTRIAAHTQHGPQRLWLQRACTQQAAALRDTLASVSATRGCVCEATVACLRVR